MGVFWCSFKSSAELKGALGSWSGRLGRDQFCGSFTVQMDKYFRLR